MKIRHPRLQMYYDSVAMNFASIGVALSVMFMNYSSFNIMACISGALFFAFMVGFTLWYWIKKGSADKRMVVRCVRTLYTLFPDNDGFEVTVGMVADFRSRGCDLYADGVFDAPIE